MKEVGLVGMARLKTLMFAGENIFVSLLRKPGSTKLDEFLENQGFIN